MDYDGGMNITLMIACVLTAGYFLYQGTRLRDVYPRKKLLVWAVLRSVLLYCLLLAAWGVKAGLPAAGATTIFLVDRSLSMGERAGEIESYISRQLKENISSRDRAAVVSFAREPMVERAVSRNSGEVKLEAAHDANFTNMQRALEFCRDYFPAGDNKRLVLITDGRENLGDAGPALHSLGGWGINLAVLPIIPPAGNDVRLVSLTGPTGARRGDSIDLGVELYADYEAQGTFRLYAGNRKLLERPVAVKAGSNSFSCGVKADGEARSVYRGEISFTGDSNPKNDFFTVAVPLRDSPAVLVIGDKADTVNIESLLAGLDFTVVSLRPGEAPREPGLLSAFGGIILANVRHGDLPGGFEAALGKTVEEQGTGLIVVGGDSAFGPGGYEATPLEQLLPVRSRMKGNEKLPDTGLVLALDCSGSMNDQSGGTRKIEMVKEAAVKSMEVLDENDYLGVLAFSDLTEWTVPLGPLAQKEIVKNRIGQLSPGGGTLIRPALEKAAEALDKADVKVKHIILLTDGQGEKEGYEKTVQKIKEAGITLSTVAVGQDADRELLRTLADSGGGRSYYTDYYRDIPGIFTRETYLSTKKYLNNRDFVPRAAGAGLPYGGGTLPPLHGYTGTGIKEGAELLLESDGGDPVLARWQYGLGRVVAWTPDLSGRWSREWIRWGGLPKFFQGLLNDCLAPYNEEGLAVYISQKGCKVEVSIAVEADGDGQSMELLLLPPTGEEKKIALQQMAPGVFAGACDLDQTGSYALDFRLVKGDSILRQARRTVYLDYSPEFAGGPEQNVFLPAAFGQVVDEGTNVFALPLERKGKAPLPLDHILPALALAALAGELWVRKML